MMMLKPFEDNTYNVLVNRTCLVSKKYWHTFANTAHLMLAIFGFLSKDSETYKKMRAPLNKYGITGKVFEAQFLKDFPRGNKLADTEELEVVPDKDLESVINNLKKRAFSEKRSMDIEDLILEIFADKDYSVNLILGEIINNAEETQKLLDELVKSFKKKISLTIEEFDEMPGIMTNLNNWVKKNKRKTLYTDKYIKTLTMALAGRSIKSAVLVGPAGCGKSEIVYELAQRINEGIVSDDLKEKIIYQLDLTGLTAGTRFRGDMEERLINIMEVVKQHPEVILFIDEIHMISSMGAGSESSDNIGNMIKPYITRGECQLIGATTNEEFTKYILKDKALARRFHKILVNEPSEEETIKILENLVPVENEFFKKKCDTGLLKNIVELSSQYNIDQANPAKSINMLEIAYAYAKIANSDTVDIDSILKAISLEYNVFVSSNKLEDTKKHLFKILLGQDKALKQVIRDLSIVDNGIVDIDKPLWSMLFAGPTGTGKTETAKIIAKCFFGSEDNLIKINCGEYSSEMDVSKLTGASTGLTYSPFIK